MRLRDLLKVIKTWDNIELSQWEGESFYPTYADLDGFKEFFVVDITSVDKGIIRVSIRENE